MEPENKIKPTRNEIKGPAVLETYADDMARVLENDTEGLVKKIIHGEEQHEAEKKNLSPESKKNKVFMLVSALLVIFGVAIIAFFLLNKNINTVPVEKQFTPLIFADKTDFDLEISGFKKEEIAQAVLNKISKTEVNIGGVEGVYLKENGQLIGLRRFLSLINSSFAPNKDPFFVSDNFMMGVVNIKEGEVRAPGEGFFILLKVRSTADIFDALREWEGKMFLDLRGFIGISLSPETSYLLTKNFEDGIVDNKNARVLYDKDGKIVLTYIFADENSVVISNSEKAIHEIVLRLASASKKI